MSHVTGGKMQSFLPLSSNTVWIYVITSWQRTSIADLYMLSIAIIYSVWLLVGGASRPCDVRIAIAPIWLHWFPHSCLMLQVWGMWVSLSQLICCGPAGAATDGPDTRRHLSRGPCKTVCQLGWWDGKLISWHNTGRLNSPLSSGELERRERRRGGQRLNWKRSNPLRAFSPL